MKITQRIVTLVAVAAIGIGGITYGVIEGLNGAESAQNGVDQREQVQLERCESGNELREGLYEEKKEELNEVKSHGVPYYEKFLSGTEAEIRQLRQESIQKIHKNLNRYEPEPCEEVVK